MTAALSTVTIPTATYAALVEALRIQMTDNGHFRWCNDQQQAYHIECSGRCLIARQALALAAEVHTL